MKIAVVGSVNRDMTIIAEKIPLKGETVRGQTFTYAPGGKGANQAVAMARLGAQVHFFGALGQDDHGQALRENFRKEGVHLDRLLVTDQASSGLALITLAEKDNTIVILPGANGLVDSAYLATIKEDLLDMDALVLQNEIPSATSFELIRWARDRDILTLFNPAPALALPEDILEAVDFFTPNEHEARVIFGHGDYEAMAKRYPQKCIITLGSAGALFAEDPNTLVQIDSWKSPVVDTTGAGDTFNGAFLVHYLRTRSVQASIRFANAAASLAIRQMGAQTGMPSRAAVEELLASKEVL